MPELYNKQTAEVLPHIILPTKNLRSLPSPQDLGHLMLMLMDKITPCKLNKSHHNTYDKIVAEHQNLTAGNWSAKTSKWIADFCSRRRRGYNADQQDQFTGKSYPKLDMYELYHAEIPADAHIDVLPSWSSEFANCCVNRRQP